VALTHQRVSVNGFKGSARCSIGTRRGKPLLLALVLVLACSHRHDPRREFEHAQLTLERGNIEAASKEIRSAYQLYRHRGDEWSWKFTILQARVLHWQSREDELLRLLASLPPTMPEELVVQRLRLEGAAYGALHRSSQAEQKLKEAQGVCDRNGYPACADVVSEWGVLAMRAGHPGEAQVHFEKALGMARADGNKFLVAHNLLTLSWSADEQTHFDEALDWASSALKIATEAGFADTAETAWGNMGWAYYKLGDREKAEGMFSEAAKEAEELGDETSETGWLTNVGYVYMDEGQPQLAEQAFLQSSDLARKTASPGDLLDALTALAFVSEQTNKLDDAKRYADEALKMAKADGNGRDVVYPLLVEGRVAARRNDPATAESDFNEVAKSPDTPVFLKWEAERSLAHLYEDENHPGPADAEYRAALSTFEAARCGLHERVDSRLPFLTNAARIYEDYIHFLVAQGKTNEALQVADYTRARTLAEGLGRPCKAKFAPDPLNAPEIARRAGGTILFYALGQGHSYGWVITPRQVRMFPLAANQAEIDAAVQSYRKKLEGPRATLEASNDGSVLYQMLVAPVQEFLKKQPSAKTIFIVPDGALNSLNFETLLPQPKHYWIEDVTISNAASLRLLPSASRQNSRLAGKLLLVGNPVAPDARPDNQYQELPNAAAQMESVRKYFPVARQQVLARGQASPAAYLGSHPEQFSYIHFVAHGMASRMSPLDSSIILSREAGSNAGSGQDDSFKLYARDIINNHPLHADLVTISACYSTGNRTYSGEGLVGLSWAFLRAGAHNVVAALWDVSDASTPQLVDEFYSELKKGESPAEALRLAKLSLLHNDPFHSPFYWAPFQLYTGS
jgi:CHAT domain-containing protein/Tfp pilus assembly protein PilF